MNEFKIKIDLVKSIPFLLDALLEIGAGIILVSRHSTSTTLLLIGAGLIVIGTIQLIRKIKTFHLTDTELIVKRPMFPFSFAEQRFQLSKVKQIKFTKAKGTHLNIISTDRSESFRIETAKENIDEFEIKLLALGIQTTREGV